MEYRTIDKLNQSLLKKILKSPQAYLRAKEKYKEDDDVTPEHYIFGNAVEASILWENLLLVILLEK